MMRITAAFAAALLSVCAGTAHAAEMRRQETQNGAALMLAALVGPYAQGLKAGQLSGLKTISEGRVKPDVPIRVIVQKILCKAGNVDIAHHACDLTVGQKITRLTGRRAHELYATLLEAGVAPEGAAGSIYTQMSDLVCIIEPKIIADKSGGGAKCNWKAQ